MDRELIPVLDKLERRVGTLESLQSGGVSLLPTYPGTADIGNGHVTGSLGADNDIIAGDDVIAGDAVTAVSMTATGTVQGATVTSTGAVNAATAFNRAGIAMNNVIVLDKVCRILDDSTSRASGYANSAVPVAGVTDIVSAWVTLPSTLKAVLFNVNCLTAAVASARIVVENPSFIVGSFTFQSATATVGATTSYAGSGVTSLDGTGKLRITFTGSANMTRCVIDIWGYIV